MRKLFALMMAAALFGAVEASADSVSLRWLSSGTAVSTVAPGASDTLQVILQHNVAVISDTVMIGLSDGSPGAPTMTAGVNTPPAGAGAVQFNVTPQTTGAFGGLALAQINAGTYTVGTITIQAGASAGSFGVVSFQRAGIDDWLDTSGYNVILPSLGTATMNVIPEPGTAGLLGLGLVGLIAVGRRSRV